MALYYSTAFRTKLLGNASAQVKSLAGATLSYVDGGGSSDTITDSGNGFVTAGFAPGMYIFTAGSTTAGNNMSNVLLTDVAAGTLTFATGTVNTAEVFPAAGRVMGIWGNDFRSIMHHGVIDIYTVGNGIPATADAAISGSTLVCRITVSSGAWTAGAFTNGLMLGVASAGAIAKSADTWSGEGLISPSGVMSFFRWKSNVADDDSADTTLYPRIQGTVGVGTSYNLNVATTTLLSGATLTINTCTFTPAASV